MSRNIKSLKTLAKHVGKSFSIVNSDGVRFFAVLEKLCDGRLCLRTTDSKADEASDWWPAWGDRRTEKWKDQWCHHVSYARQLTEELKSCSLITGQMPEDTTKADKPVHYATEEEVKEHEGYMCKLADGTIGKLVKRGKEDSPLLLLKEEAFDGSVGWCLGEHGWSEKYAKEGWKYGWNMHDQGCETAKVVEFFKEGKEDAWTSSVWPQDYINKVFKTDEGKYIAFLKSISEDGAGPAVCCFTGSSLGWIMYKGEKDTETTGVPKEFFKVFKSAFFASKHDEYGTPEEYICSVKDTDKLQKIYEELNTAEVKEAPKKKGYLTRKKIKEAVGKYCKLADGQTAFIAEARGSGNPLICFSERVDGRHGWTLGSSPDTTKRYMSTAKEFKRGWYVTDDVDARQIKVVEILEDKTEESEKTLSDKTAESKKTILDMTVRELLEKLNEIVER